jgi:hypothetical protein
MRKLFFIFIGLSLFSSANSQIGYGLRCGISINTEANQYSSREASFLGIQAAAFSKIPLAQSIIFHPSIGYYPKGERLKDLTFEDQFGNDIGSGDMVMRYDYLQLALPVQFMILKKKIRLFAGAGPFISYAVGGVIKYKQDSGRPTSEPKSRPMAFEQNGAQRFDAGVEGLISVFTGRHWTASLNYDKGFVNVDSYTKRQTISGGISIGYVFK